MTVSEVILHEEVLPRTLKSLLDARFPEWHKWEPETLETELRDLIGAPVLPEVFERIMALQTFLNTELFWDDVLVFENICLAFNGSHVDPDLIQGASPREIAFGVMAANQVRKHDNYVSDILEYIRQSHKTHGVLVYHPILRFAQPHYDGFREQIARFVKNRVRKSEPPPEEIDQKSPIEVQYMKTFDCIAYVREKMELGEQVERQTGR
jgi:hypothetical protein